tara:strand:+ start:57 stop:458 length:402 start_codon:yes stop_codon:yes gene_type:complete
MIRIILALSFIINGILLMTIAGVMPFLLFTAALVVAGLVWYIIMLLRRISSINEDVNDIFDYLEGFSEHLESLSQMSMFYGDETLQGMIVHSQEIMEKIYDYQLKYELDSEFDEEQEGDSDEEEFYGPPPEEE